MNFIEKVKDRMSRQYGKFLCRIGVHSFSGFVDNNPNENNIRDKIKFSCSRCGISEDEVDSFKK